VRWRAGRGTNAPAMAVQNRAVFEEAILRVFRMGGIGPDYQRGWAPKQSASAPFLRCRLPGNARGGTHLAS